ncbi:hypothetical protein NA57DRAFT_36513 [Rhizodiscina lignyota]|uniref:Prolyl 4-hydroxylase alpha subunit domain-containing protein n=1 Tax=Rhizodiscina lignyota TaxID=1504668 RepID=A0A9P4IJL2_9PEZI|nr:hypothetical protein NA57DRAFT_36513 [Rhizodiscina lignyota]
MASNNSVLPADFLSGPGPRIEVNRIDFTKTDLPEYKDNWAVVLDNVLSKEECDLLVSAAEAHSGGEWERAMVNVGGGMQRMITDTRNCGRIIWDDGEVAQKIWARCEEHVPEIQKLDAWPKVTGNGPMMRKEIWEMTRLNERLRFLKYTSGEYFKPHCDGMYETPDHKERSYFTLHLYLNDITSDPSAPLKGGATTFHSMDMDRRFDVEPKIGRVLLFQHAYLVHSGDDVLGGVKLTLRTDIMYQKSKETSTKEPPPKEEKKKSFWGSKQRT